MVDKDQLIQIINQLITPPAETWKNDPFEVLVKQCPKVVSDKYLTPHSVDSIPSTSDDVRTVNADARVHYSQLLGSLFLELASTLSTLRTLSPDEYQLISLQDVSLIKKSFEFFLLTGILPFLEPGVGLPASTRSTFIKSWKLYDGNKESCIERLDFAAKVIVALLESNEAIAVQFLPKFIYDILAVRYQLLELKVDKYELQLEDIISKCPMDVLFGGLMFLTQDRKSVKTPMWLKISCGKQMTKILVDKDGLSYLLQYYRERAGDTWTDNLPLTKQVAWHLATVPKMFKHPLQYHEIISNQFFELIWSQKVLDKTTVTVFTNYVDELRTRFWLNADLTVFDKILNFWEILGKKLQDRTLTTSEKIETFSPNYVRNLQLLSQLQNTSDTKRLRALIICFIACIEQIPYIKDILKGALDGVGSLGYTIYYYVITPSLVVQLHNKSKITSMIEEVGESNVDESPADELWVYGFDNPDDGVARRLDTAFYVVDNVLSSAQTRTLMEMMNAALEDFLKVSEKERDDDFARFVQLDGSKHFSSSHAHLVVGCCYERLISIAGDHGFSQEECIQLIKISESILNNATAKFLRIVARKRAVDVFQLSAAEKKEFEHTRDTARMCLPIISTIFFITQGTPRMQDVHLKSMEAMANFTKAADLLPSEDPTFNSAVDEAKGLLRKLKIDVNQVSAPVVPQRNERRRYNQTDVCNDWIEELHDDEPAVKGGALILIAKAFRAKSWHCQKLLDYAAFDTVKDMVSDTDSYVYLSAINCLCEMALFDRHVFDGFIEYYEEIASIPNKDERLIIRVGRTSEALGKLLIARGETSIAYFDRLATVFMSGINEKDELSRASSCGAFGNLLMATGGKGVAKWMDQLLQTITNVLRTDRSPLVRRSATDLIRHSLHSVGRDMFVVLRERLLDIHREVRQLWRTDRDETVRLHAQLCVEEIAAALRQNQEDVDREYQRKLRL
ncbi:hypothetical protein GCK72_009583 [Caenorhabditis remanei]|uniref:RNA polymerase II assembly factor Rtp1 C-terminal domain-containing protein n=1 Tax=Caenorhabditis remanei TaxID=31234 RepID=A0A6A5H255_CAERE|nr:hypothetical protein GCK72_009583 [Caenorhabditis remanei]KAF1761327.1 hypothetical protein GCK72_009583 [Caenorhabditis remanei]